MKDYWQPLQASRYNLHWILENSPIHRGLKRNPNKKESLLSEPQAVSKLNRTLLTMETYAMPAKSRRAMFNNSDIKFAYVRLGEEEREAFIEWRKLHEEQIWTFLHQLAENGWKASFGEDMANACYIASHTCNNEDDRNYKVCVSSRSDDISEALLMNVFKIGVMYDGKKLPTDNPGNSWG